MHTKLWLLPVAYSFLLLLGTLLFSNYSKMMMGVRINYVLIMSVGCFVMMKLYDIDRKLEG